MAAAGVRGGGAPPHRHPPPEGHRRRHTATLHTGINISIRTEIHCVNQDPVHARKIPATSRQIF